MRAPVSLGTGDASHHGKRLEVTEGDADAGPRIVPAVHSGSIHFAHLEAMNGSVLLRHGHLISSLDVFLDLTGKGGWGPGGTFGPFCGGSGGAAASVEKKPDAEDDGEDGMSGCTDHRFHGS